MLRKFYKATFAQMSTNISDKLAGIGLKPKTIESTLKNSALTSTFESILDRNSIEKCEKDVGNNLYHLITKSNVWIKEHQMDYCVKNILDGSLSSRTRVDLAIQYFKVNNDSDAKSDDNQFKEFCGVGVEVSAEQLQEYLNKFVEDNYDEMVKTKPNHPVIMANLRKGIKFVEPKDLIMGFNKLIKSPEFKERLQKSKDALVKPKKKSDKPVKKTEKEIEEENQAAVKKYRLEKFMAKDLAEALNTPEIFKAHKERTKGKVITRFPPEPNGHLHIGHCKAIRFNFKIAQDYEGYTYLRFDDTNPAKEKQEYIDNIIAGVKWLGYTPYEVTYASDYFQRIYETAIKLIERGKAFVCFLSQADAKEYRESKKPSPWRDTSVEENLKQFSLMKSGFYGEGECVLRAKIDYLSSHTTLQDPSIYRIKHVPHPHVKDKWCIYPLYDFTHSLCDNFEDITHSLCTLEFDTRRELYYWSLDQLDMFKPYVWEYSRLNITYTVLSKRKINRLVETGKIWGWDDPRLLTINGMKRRGYSPEAICYFCDLVSVTRRGNDNSVGFEFFEHVMRSWLFPVCQKSFIVLRPVKLVFSNFLDWSTKQPTTYMDENFLHPIRLSNEVYVDREDVRSTDSKGFWGIAPGKTVRLKYGPFVKISEVKVSNGEVTSIVGELIPLESVGNYKKIKGILHWVNGERAHKVKVNVFDKLFTRPFPGAPLKKGGPSRDILDDLTENSHELLEDSVIPSNLVEFLKPDTKLQFERLGFYGLDIDSDFEKKEFVFNSIVDFKAKNKKKMTKK
jgi:glutaminyl-tRNA synthetase